MDNTIVHWQNRAARYGLYAPPGAVVFAQDNNDGTTSGKTHANNGQRELRDLSKFKCFKFQEFSHFSNKCPNGDKIGDMHANVGTKETSDDNMDGLMSNLDIDSYASYLFGSFSMVTNESTKSYLEAVLATPTQFDRSVVSGRSAEAFHQHNRSIPMSYILLDNQSTVGILCNPTILQNIHASDRTLHIICNTGTISVNQVCDLHG